MFTGLIEHIGSVSAITPVDNSVSGGNGFSLCVSNASPLLADCNIGDSIAINGVCLTVTEFDNDSFKVGLSPETLSRSSLGELNVGGAVNLERAMRSDTRFGGHFVQGHVDGTVVISSKVVDGNSLRLTFQVPESQVHHLLPYLIEKGYITLDGTSLTITDVADKDRSFAVMLIAHTQSKITLPTKNVGDKVNVEVDMISKYVERSVLSSLGVIGSNNKSTALRSLVQTLIQETMDARTTKG